LEADAGAEAEGSELPRLRRRADGATPSALRHSFASLLLHEGRSVIYVARQLGHDARLTLTTYGHVIDELDELPRVSAEAAGGEASRTTKPAIRGRAPITGGWS
jgi:hypothetical protein